MVRTPGGSGEGVEERSGEVELVARRATRQCRGSGETGHRRQERRAGGGSRGNKRGSATTVSGADRRGQRRVPPKAASATEIQQWRQGEGRWLAGGRGGVQRWPPEEEAVHRALLPPPLWVMDRSRVWWDLCSSVDYSERLPPRRARRRCRQGGHRPPCCHPRPPAHHRMRLAPRHGRATQQ
ncbi:Os02g0693650 [Oryza sativa Japonica Group]|uniref:Os02g0693650 protein n=1 Tax=Oryza sativa subsp. japonica TaxID=39947 RepID=A0A0P0VN97_ORYSJ|nr:Os02g0693650 [Oryza sativa Japonica Group]